MKPFHIQGPAQICFSGGRTSAYMLWRLLHSHAGRLPNDVHVVFTNTGKERPETLDFLRDCGERWGISIVWLEWDGFLPPGRSHSQFRVVDYATASRKGEPFELLIDTLKILPNPTQRICTAYLKVRTGMAYMHSLGYEEWENFLGIRADEPLRIARLRASGRDNRGGEPVLPLVHARIAKADISRFWAHQDFDLQLSNNNGVTPDGNCDLCYLKPPSQVLSQIRRTPSDAVWWMRQEKKPLKDGTPATFRNDRPSYAQMHRMALNHGELFAFAEDEALIDCMCGG